MNFDLFKTIGQQLVHKPELFDQSHFTQTLHGTYGTVTTPCCIGGLAVVFDGRDRPGMDYGQLRSQAEQALGILHVQGEVLFAEKWPWGWFDAYRQGQTRPDPLEAEAHHISFRYRRCYGIPSGWLVKPRADEAAQIMFAISVGSLPIRRNVY